jgi:hypothetical protein
MKFILQIEVEAPEHTGNPDYPRAVHAIQRLQDWLKAAKSEQLHYLVKVPGQLDFSDDIAYVAAVNEEIAFIDAATMTVKELQS